MNALTVHQVLGYLKELIETNAALADLWISGEISNLSRSSAGHVYFTLKDPAGQLRCAFFRRQNAGIKLEHGLQVLAHGRVSIYEQRGELNFIVDFVHTEGEGILNAQFERLKEMLEEEGLFAQERKRPLPLFPRRIGVVTSPTGAVFHDICTVVGRRWPLAQIILAPSAVQGDTAAPGVVSAIADLNDHGNVDVIVVARGGGSLEELWPFNEERVCRAIFGSRVPVVSAIGHETDVTLADYVADVRAPTPSAAAELIVPDQLDMAMRVGGLTATLLSWMQSELDGRREQLRWLQAALDRGRPDLDGPRERLQALLARADRGLKLTIARQRAQVETRVLQLGSLNPCAVLERGYAVVHDDKGNLIASVTAAPPGAGIAVRVRDGAFAATVRNGHAG